VRNRRHVPRRQKQPAVVPAPSAGSASDSVQRHSRIPVDPDVVVYAIGSPENHVAPIAVTRSFEGV
jgi:hypothetical protein